MDKCYMAWVLGKAAGTLSLHGENELSKELMEVYNELSSCKTEETELFGKAKETKIVSTHELSKLLESGKWIAIGSYNPDPNKAPVFLIIRIN